jgi:hypothetical protein
MSTDSSDNAVVSRPSTAHRVRVLIFRVVAALAGLFFVVAAVLMASAPWLRLRPDQEVRTELNRWFLNVAGSVDAITAGVLLALALRPRPDTVNRQIRRSGHCGWRDHPSLPALLRRQARDISVEIPTVATNVNAARRPSRTASSLIDRSAPVYSPWGHNGQPCRPCDGERRTQAERSTAAYSKIIRTAGNERVTNRQ